MKMKKRIRFFLFPLVLLFVILPLSSTVMAADPIPKVNLGSTETYAVLAGSTITNTGSTVIDGNFGGDIGLYPGTSITGFPPGTVGGTTHVNDDAAIQAKTDLVTAYNDAAGRTATKDMSGTDLGGQTLKTGVYKFSSAAKLTGTLTLDAQGDPEAVFIFQIGSALTTATGSKVKLINGARFCRVFWQVTSSATLGTTTEFAGHILALQSITCNTGATVQGQLLARNAAVTLDSNKITNGLCPTITATTTPTATKAPAATAVPTKAPAATAVPTKAPAATAVPTKAAGATPVPTTGATELTKTGENTQKQIMIGGLLLVISGSLVFLLVSRRKNIQR